MAANEIDDDFVICEHGQADKAGSAPPLCMEEGVLVDIVRAPFEIPPSLSEDDIVFVDALATPQNGQETQSSSSEDDWEDASQADTVTTTIGEEPTNKPIAEVQQLADNGAEIYFQTLCDNSPYKDSDGIDPQSLAVLALSDDDLNLYSDMFEVRFNVLVEADKAKMIAKRIVLERERRKREEQAQRILEEVQMLEDKRLAKMRFARDMKWNVAAVILGLGTSWFLNTFASTGELVNPRAADGWW